MPRIALALLLVFTSVVPASAGAAPGASAGSLPELASRALQPATTGAVRLSLADAVAGALGRNAALAVRRLDPAIARARLLQEQGALDDSVTAQLQRQHNETPTATSLSGATVSENDSRTTNFGYRMRLEEGSVVGMDLQNQRSATNSRFQTLNPSYQSQLVVSYTRPLLRGAGREVVTAGISVARNGVEQGRLRLRKQVLDTLATVEKQYWDLVFARQDREVQRFALELARELLDYNLSRRDSGLGSEVQVIEARATEAVRADNLELASRVVRDAQAALHRLLALPDAGPGTELVPVESPAQLPPPASLERALAVAFVKRPERADALLEIANKSIRLKMLANQKLPKVDLVASYNQNGLGGGFGTAFDQAVGSDFPGYVVGVQVELPLRRRAARGAWDQGRLEKEQALLQLKAVEDQLQEEVTKAVSALDTALRRVEVSRRAADLSEKQLEAARARYQQGLIANFDLLRFQQDLADARSRALKAVVDAREAGLALQASTGSLLEDRGVSLEEAAAAPAPAR